ncbi:OsmC family protein [Bacillus sp. FJAT-47783]|uniref:OsmC family protein n=1 Tax=Bacillus sp. FJAT-47783 TaxID=2922712 RepID=UPI001FAD0732|nr:OsmC family protein [Bacillus sp. FJAT-47783]
MEKHSFTVRGHWEGDRFGQGKINTDDFETVVSVPKQLEGPGIGTNPEELFISAATNCYMITFAAILSKRNVEYSKINIISEGIVTKDGKRLKFEQIIHKPVVYVSKSESIEAVNKLAHMAEKSCFISQTLKGNVKITVEPMVKSIEIG